PWFYAEITKLLDEYTVKPHVIYGDTDSIFIDFHIAHRETGVLIETIQALETSIQLGILCSKLLNKILPHPQNIVYEKTFWPFVILSKKRYVGNLYGFTTNRYYQNSMGIVLKRR